MKTIKAFAALLCTLLMLIIPVAASTLEETHPLRLTVYFSADEIERSGVQFDLFCVAQRNDQGGFTALPAFSQYSFNLGDMNDSALSGLANTLEGYVLRDKITSNHTGKTDEEGKIVFPAEGKKLSKGLYLLTAKSFVRDEKLYTVQPVLIVLPVQQADGSTIFDATIRAKSEYVPDAGGDSLMTRKVLKVWKHNGNTAKPKEVVVQLLRDGEVYDTVTLNAENFWRHTWSDLKKAHQWTLVEKAVPGYSAVVQQEGITFVVTNTYNKAAPTPTPTLKPGTTPSPTHTPTTTPATSTPKPGNPSKPPKLPQTGQMWWPVPMMLFAGLVLVVIGMMRRRMS